jgi:hypothetical protein
MKKRVCILLTGQMRVNSLNLGELNDNTLIDSFNTCLLNDNFKEKYNFDVFISTDSIDIEKAKTFFGDENLKNVFLYDSNWYLNNINHNIKSFEHYEDKYSKINFEECYSNSHILFMIYRLYTAYNLMINYQMETDIKYDYVIKLRPDSKLTKNIMELFDILETTDTQIITEHDHLVITKYELSDIFKLMENYGEYNENVNQKYNLYKYFFRDGIVYPDNVFRFSPEKQFSDNISDKILSKGYDFNTAFKGITYPNYTSLYGGGGNYKYM